MFNTFKAFCIFATLIVSTNAMATAPELFCIDQNGQTSVYIDQVTNKVTWVEEGTSPTRMTIDEFGTYRGGRGSYGISGKLFISGIESKVYLRTKGLAHVQKDVQSQYEIMNIQRTSSEQFLWVLEIRQVENGTSGKNSPWTMGCLEIL